MTDLTNLPASTTPAEFIQHVQDALKEYPAPADASPDKAQFTLSGDGGGQWYMGFVDGQLQVDEGTTEAPPVAISLSVDAWRSFMLGPVRDAVKAEVETTAFDPALIADLYKNADKVEALKAIEGNLQLVVNAEDGDHKLTITTGGVAADVENPTAKVSVALADFVAMVSGKENPQQAFFMGKLQVDGDLNLLMQMAGQLM